MPVDPLSDAGVSIYITAYRAQAYILQCLESIYDVMAGVSYPWELQVGVDGCGATLETVRRFGQRKNMRLVYFGTNVGTYVASNTLLKSRRYTEALRFDADDIMAPAMAAYLDPGNLKPMEIVQLPFRHFKGCPATITMRVPCHKVISPARRMPAYMPDTAAHSCGQIITTAGIWEKLGGYRAWTCAADADLCYRANLAGISIRKLSKIDAQTMCRASKIHPKYGVVALFRRLHARSLTGMPTTGMRSSLRKAYKDVMAKTTEAYITPTTAACMQIW